MKKPKVLIVEDNFLLAAHHAELVQQELDAEAVVTASVEDALNILPHKITPEEIAIAFLDIEVLDGQTFPVARKLKDYNVPFVFVSGNVPASLPPDLQNVPFLPKPVDPGHLVRVVKTLSSAFKEG